MKTNLEPEIVEEINFFVKKFVENGWELEDTFYLKKKFDFITNPDANNEEWKHSASLSFSPYILQYCDRDIKTHKAEWITTVWIKVTTGLSENKDVKYPEDCPRLRQLCKTLEQELKSMDIQTFYDEDSFLNRFTKPVITPNTRISNVSFYVNKDYPEGMWANHTL